MSKYFAKARIRHNGKTFHNVTVNVPDDIDEKSAERLLNSGHLVSGKLASQAQEEAAQSVAQRQAREAERAAAIAEQTAKAVADRFKLENAASQGAAERMAAEQNVETGGKRTVDTNDPTPTEKSQQARASDTSGGREAEPEG